MKQILITITLALVASVGMGQTKNPRKHVYYDTIKSVKERIDYAPDTISVYFKQMIISKIDSIPSRMANAVITSSSDYTVYESWHKGFVIWQTYKKSYSSAMTLSSSGSLYMSSETQFYTDPYPFSKTYPGIFLYEDKSVCNNIVVCVIKR